MQTGDKITVGIHDLSYSTVSFSILFHCLFNSIQRFFLSCSTPHGDYSIHVNGNGKSETPLYFPPRLLEAYRGLQRPGSSALPCKTWTVLLLQAKHTLTDSAACYSIKSICDKFTREDKRKYNGVVFRARVSCVSSVWSVLCTVRNKREHIRFEGTVHFKSSRTVVSHNYLYVLHIFKANLSPVILR